MVRNKYVIIKSKRRFDVKITYLLRSLFAGIAHNMHQCECITIFMIYIMKVAWAVYKLQFAKRFVDIVFGTYKHYIVFNGISYDFDYVNDQLRYFVHVTFYHIEAETKLPSFRRRHFQLHFRE